MCRQLLACLVGSSLAVQTHAAPTIPQPSATPLKAQNFGANLQPRWPGSANLLPRIGIARVEWAYAVRFPGTSSLQVADISGGLGPVRVKVRNGDCFALASSTRGDSTTLFVSAASCPPSPSDHTSRGRRIVDSSSGDFSAEVSAVRDQSTLFFKRGLKPRVQVLKIPMSVIAIGSLPDPHGLTYGITLFGTQSSAP